MRVQRVQVSPQGRGRPGQRLGCDGFVQGRTIGIGVNQRLFDKGGAVKIWRARVSHAARVGFGELEQGGQGFGWGRYLFAVGIERELRHAPRCFEAFHWFGKIDAGGRFSGHIHVLKTWQAFGKRAKQQAFSFHRQKVFAIDPDQVDSAVTQLAGRFFAAHAFDDVDGVGHLYMFELHTITLRHLDAGPLQIGVDAFTAGPGVEIHGLAAGFVFDAGPGCAGLRKQWQGGAGAEQGQSLAAGKQGGL